MPRANSLITSLRLAFAFFISFENEKLSARKFKMLARARNRPFKVCRKRFVTDLWPLLSHFYTLLAERDSFVHLFDRTQTENTHGPSLTTYFPN